MSYYRPPDDADPPTPSVVGDEPVGTTGVRKRRLTEGAELDAPADVWIQVFSSTDSEDAFLYKELISQRGIEVWLRIDRDDRTQLGRPTYEVLVPEPESDLVEALVDGAIGDEVALVRRSVPVDPALQPGDDLFMLRRRMDIELPYAGQRKKDRAARRALAELDGRPASSRPDQVPVNGCRRQALIGGAIILVLLFGSIILLSVI